MSDFAHSTYNDIQHRLLDSAIAALKQANTHAVFSDPGNEHWETMSIVNATHAGELFIKAAIAKVHPLFIFQNIFDFDKDQNFGADLSINRLIKHGRSHDFSKLPSILWATAGIRISNMKVYVAAQEARNAVQHFIFEGERSLGDLSLEFIYEVIDPLIKDQFGLYAIHYHEDHSVGYDYVVDCLIRSNLKFSIPSDFDLTEIYLSESLVNNSLDYCHWLKSELSSIGKSALLDKNWMKDQV